VNLAAKTNKSITRQGDLIEGIFPEEVDVIAIQEPHLDFLGLSQGGNGWQTVYPDNHK
jgi:hypothetical protein